MVGHEAEADFVVARSVFEIPNLSSRGPEWRLAVTMQR